MNFCPECGSRIMMVLERFPQAFVCENKHTSELAHERHLRDKAVFEDTLSDVELALIAVMPESRVKIMAVLSHVKASIK